MMETVFSIRKAPVSRKITLLNTGALLSAYASREYALYVSFVGAVYSVVAGRKVDRKTDRQQTTCKENGRNWGRV
jgi:hypothetical protein